MNEGQRVVDLESFGGGILPERRPPAGCLGGFQPPLSVRQDAARPAGKDAGAAFALAYPSGVTRFHDDAGMREVFRGDLSSVELAKAVLEEAGIEAQRRWELGGGVQLSPSETPLIGGKIAVLLVPSIAWDEAREVLGHFDQPEPDYPTELSEDIHRNIRMRRIVAGLILLLIFLPFLSSFFLYLVRLLTGY